MDFSRYENLRTLVRANFSEQTQALVDEALVYADGKLASLTRYDGSPLLTHAAAVAGIVISEVGLGRNSTISAILHDVVRLAHKQLPAEEFLALTADIRSRFGEQVVGITIGMCNISELKLKVAKEQAENFRDLLEFNVRSGFEQGIESSGLSQVLGIDHDHPVPMRLHVA